MRHSQGLLPARYDGNRACAHGTTSSHACHPVSGPPVTRHAAKQSAHLQQGVPHQTVGSAQCRWLYPSSHMLIVIRIPLALVPACGR